MFHFYTEEIIYRNTDQEVFENQQTLHQELLVQIGKILDQSLIDYDQAFIHLKSYLYTKIFDHFLNEDMKHKEILSTFILPHTTNVKTGASIIMVYFEDACIVKVFGNFDECLMNDYYNKHYSFIRQFYKNKSFSAIGDLSDMDGAPMDVIKKIKEHSLKMKKLGRDKTYIITDSNAVKTYVSKLMGFEKVTYNTFFEVFEQFKEESLDFGKLLHAEIIGHHDLVNVFLQNKLKRFF